MAVSTPPSKDPGGAETPAVKGKKRHFFRSFLKFFCLLLLLLLASLGGALWWLFQTQNGQDWLVSRVNGILEPKEGQQGLNFRITSLSGSLPFNFKIGLEAGDVKGVWLSAPDNIFTLNWRELPSCLHISALKAINIDLSRFPELPASPSEEKTTKPISLPDVQNLLREADNFLSQNHWWLPQIRLDGIEIRNAVLPAGILPGNQENGAKEARLAADLNLEAFFPGKEAKANLAATLRDSLDGRVSLPSFSFRQLGINADLGLKAGQGILDSALNLQSRLSETALDHKDIPADLLGDEISLNLSIQADATTVQGKETASLKLVGPALNAGHLTLNNKINWQAGPEWKDGKLDGATSLSLEALFNPLLDDWLEEHPGSPLAMLRKPVRLSLDSSGNLPREDVKLALSVPEILYSGHSLANLALSIASHDLELPLPPYGMDLLKKEHHFDLNLSASVDKEPVSLAARTAFQALAQARNKDQEAADTGKDPDIGNAWLASLNDLELSALGLRAKGHLAALIPPGRMPALDGQLVLNLDQWGGIQKFIPDQQLSGHVNMDLHLDNAAARHASSQSIAVNTPQNALLNLDIPSFAMRPQNGGEPVELKDLRARVDLGDIFGKPVLDMNLNAARIQAAGMKLDANVKAIGPISGPLNAEISSKGDIAVKLAANWSPGIAILKNCDISLVLPASMSPSGKAVPLGIKSSNPAEIRYGDQGIGVSNLDLRMLPSGRLRVNGALSPDKLAMNVNLENLDFKPWQILAPQIPLGYASLSASLSGAPKTPGGKFNLVLKDVTLPGNPLPPFGLTLAGGIANETSGSALNLRLNLDQKSLKALGCDKSSISAKIPLIFGADGIPKLNMSGPLAASINWDGALGPVWNLLPMPDKRLNGRVAIHMDAGGSIKAPKIRGGLNVNKARFEDLLLGVLITDINLKLELFDHGRQKKVEGALDSLPGALRLALNASDGRGGTINISGGAAIDGTDLDIKAKINRLRPLRRRDIHIEFSGDATVAGSALAPVINGQLLVNQGEVLLNNLEVMGSVTTLPISDGKQVRSSASFLERKEKKAEEKDAGSINFKIDMLPRFTVEGRGLTSIWTAHLLVSGSPFKPSITGNISSVKGNFDFLGKNFALTKGIVFFGGGSLSNPLINMELTNETPDLTAHIIVSGPVNKIKLQLTSDPQLPRDEILSRVLFGRSVGDLSRFEALQLAAGVAQLAGLGSGDSILSSAKKALGVDVLRLGTSATDAAGEPGDMTAGGTTIEMGKYINDMIYMGVQQGMKADSTAFIIQMELTPRTNLEIRTEQNNTWGGLKWKYNY